MKKQFYTLLTTLVVSLITSSAIANNEEPNAEKTKSYSKTYPLGGGDNVNLNNQFGELKVTTWNKNEIKVPMVKRSVQALIPSVTGKKNVQTPKI